MNLGTAQALAFCRVPRKASADDTVFPGTLAAADV